MSVAAFIFGLLFSLSVTAQLPLFDSVNRQREQINRSGLTVLGSWAVLNMGTGLVGRANSSGTEKYFHQTNIYWGGANLLLASIGLFRKKGQGSNSAAETFRLQTGAEKLFLVNTALDLGYMVFGLYTRERATRFTGEKKDRLLGTGKSFLVQGGFLAIFDGVMYVVHTKNGSQLNQKLQNLSLGPTKNGFGLICRF